MSSPDKMLEYLIDTHRVLLDKALSTTPGGDGDGLIALRQQLDDERLRRELVEQERDRLADSQKEYDNLQKIVLEERASNDAATRELNQQIEQRDAQLAAMQRTANGLQAQITRLENEPAPVPPDMEDIARFIGQAVEFFEEDPDRSFKNLSRAHLNLQGKEETT